MPTAVSASQPVPFSQSHHAVVTLTSSRGATTSNFTVTQAGNKDNVYIVTLPQHQVKALSSLVKGDSGLKDLFGNKQKALPFDR